MTTRPTRRQLLALAMAGPAAKAVSRPATDPATFTVPVVSVVPASASSVETETPETLIDVTYWTTLGMAMKGGAIYAEVYHAWLDASGQVRIEKAPRGR